MRDRGLSAEHWIVGMVLLVRALSSGWDARSTEKCSSERRFFVISSLGVGDPTCIAMPCFVPALPAHVTEIGCLQYYHTL